MTRQEFIENVTSWGRLLNFCYDNDCDVCEDIISHEDMYEEIESDLREMVGERSWTDIRDLLNDIDTDYDFYRRDGVFDYYPLNDYEDCDEYKESVLDWMDDNGYWDEEDVEEADEDEEEQPFDDPSGEYTIPAEEDEPATEEEDFSIGELMGMCSVQFLNMQRAALQQKEQDDTVFRQYLNRMPNVLR